MFRINREPREGPDVWLPLKTALFIVGALGAVAGMATGTGWLINAAIVILLIAVLLRFLGRR